MEDESKLVEYLEEAREALVARLDGREPRIGLVLGSGLNPLAEEIEDPVYIPFGEVPNMRVSTAWGHVGRFVCGNLGGKCVLAMQGRLHAYEGYSSLDIAFPIWLMSKIGIETLITTNAAGAINENYHVGEFCIMSDQINFTGRNPTANPAAAKLTMRFFSMTDAFDPELRELAKRVAAQEEVPVQEGVYLGLLGCSFETPAEIRAFRTWGADTVAMSVCEEVIAARQMGMRVLGISLLSNMAAGVGSVDGVGGASPDGDEVMATAKAVEANFSRLVRGIVAGM